MMTNINKLLGSLRCRLLPRTQAFGAVRSYSNHSNLPKESDDHQITKKDEDRSLAIKETASPAFKPSYWNERKAIRQLKRKNTFPRNVTNTIDLANGLVRIRKNFPGTLKGMLHGLQRLREKREIIEQKFLPQRCAVLKPDLAAAHFLVRRGGAVKFIGQTHWVGITEKNVSLPNTYIPGMYVEAIKLEGTNLYYEGLENIANLSYLNSLSLKNLENVNDWWLDWISSEYDLTLKHLDLTNCTNVTYRGLSCFYRFENLETLNVEGIPESPEFKLACIMLQDIMPELNIKGIDLSLPEEIKAVEIKEDKASVKVNATEEM